jgi:DNA-directed RNA polymerase subunit F
MSKNNESEKILSLPEVKKLLEAIGEENLDQFQRRALDYVSKFSKLDLKKAKTVVKKLIKEYDLDEEEAIQIVNSMPKSVSELKIFLAGGRKIIETSKLEAIAKLLEDSSKIK